MVRFVVIGAGPAGVQAATHAARLGAEVTLVEREVVGGAANLWDCIPSKAMIATGGHVALARRSAAMGLTDLHPGVDLPALRARIARIEEHLRASLAGLLGDQGVRVIAGTGRLAGSPGSATPSTRRI